MIQFAFVTDCCTRSTKFTLVIDSASYKRKVRLKPNGTRWRKGGELKGKLANGAGCQYSHTTSERGVPSITTADAHTSAASSRLNWRPRQFKWTRPFRRKAKSGFCACAITFQTHYTNSGCSCTNLSAFVKDPLCSVFPQLYRVSHELRSLLRESVPYVKVYRYNPKHLCPKLNGYGDNGQRSLKLWQLLHTYWLPNTY